LVSFNDCTFQKFGPKKIIKGKIPVHV